MVGPRGFEHENILPSDLKRLEACEKRIGYRFQDPNHLVQALTHSSLKTIDNPCNERMEFLGDSVLGMVMTEFLFNFFPDRPEGELTQIKSAVVSTTTLAEESQRLGLDEVYAVGKGVTSRRKLPNSLMANVFEAVIAAIYLDGGIFEAKEFIVRNLYHQVLAVNQKEHSVNYKSILQQHLQREDGSTPNYRVLSESGPDHAKEFVVQAMLKRKSLGTGEGTTKKEAEQAAAKEALEQLGIDPSA